MTASADVIAFLADNPTADFGSRCCTGCGAERDMPDQRWCAECRREYRRETQEIENNRVTFHEQYPELSRFLFLRRQAAARGLGQPITDQDFIIDLLAPAVTDIQ